MDYLQALQRRYSVKKFDSSRPVPADLVRNILEAAKLSASSLGLQPYELIVAESAAMREKLIPAFYNPSQISTCSHLIIITAKNVGEEYVSRYFNHLSAEREITLESLTPFRKSISSHLQRLSSEEVTVWAEKQSYIVLGNLMFAAALEGVDTCPMEGFDAKKLGDIIGLEEGLETAAVTLALGYRSADDEFQNFKKVRKPDETLFKFI